ncbi:MAG: U32 family peptidase [Clostridiales bacterium]|nr:U32 family peptidase [Clostridiales bacterium]
MLKKIELLAPAGDMECLQTALRFGADAAYIGGSFMQLRADCVAFTDEEIGSAAALMHEHGKKLYVTVNSFAKNGEIELLGDYAKRLYALGADAAIVSDIGALVTMKNAQPELQIHISTQANCCNYAAARTYYDMGASRVVLARELTIDEISQLRAKTPPELELEAFVHGAMCMAYSGRCLISSFITGRSGNRGECTQPCRWEYYLVEQKRPNEFFKVEQQDGCSAVLSSHDLKTISFLGELEKAGITSFKIEGRMKTPYYLATVVNAYRRAMDGTADIESLERELRAFSHRPYSDGFYHGELVRNHANDGLYHWECTFAGTVKACENGVLTVEQRNFFKLGDVLEVVSPDSLGQSFTVENITDENGESVPTACHPKNTYFLPCGLELKQGDILRVRIDNEK